jgi:hypothetical protein
LPAANVKGSGGAGLSVHLAADRTAEVERAVAGLARPGVWYVERVGRSHLLRRVARHHDDPDDSVVLERQAHLKIALIRHFAGFTPASDLMCAGNEVAVNFLELGLRLFHLELLVSARLPKHLLAGLDATKGAARRHRFDIGIE